MGMNKWLINYLRRRSASAEEQHAADELERVHRKLSYANMALRMYKYDRHIPAGVLEDALDQLEDIVSASVAQPDDLTKG